MKDLSAFFTSSVPAGIRDAIGARGAVFDLLEEGADVFGRWEVDI